MPEGDAERYTPRRALSDEDITLPRPVDDRDRVREHDGQLFQYVSEQLEASHRRDVARAIGRVDDVGFDRFRSLDDETQTLVTKGYSRYGPGTQLPTPQNVTEKLEAELGIRVSTSLAEKLSIVDEEIEWADPDAYSPQRKSGREDWNVLDVLEEAGDGDVYMSVSLTPDKAELAWALDDDNQVVVVEDTDDYDRFSDLFGWTRLKDLSLYNISERHPNLSDSVVDELERTRGGGSGSSSESYTDSPGKRPVKVRTGEAGHGSFTTKTASKISDTLEDGDALSVKQNPIEHLLVYRQTEHESVRVGSEYCHGNVARVVVPEYIADYLLDVPNTHESFDSIRECIGDETAQEYKDEDSDGSVSMNTRF
jgi:hypothetical protein